MVTGVGYMYMGQTVNNSSGCHCAPVTRSTPPHHTQDERPPSCAPALKTDSLALCQGWTLRPIPKMDPIAHGHRPGSDPPSQAPPQHTQKNTVTPFARTPPVLRQTTHWASPLPDPPNAHRWPCPTHRWPFMHTRGPIHRAAGSLDRCCLPGRGGRALGRGSVPSAPWPLTL